MAQQALGAGMIVPRKRVLFGLLDADGWAWAGVKAAVVARDHHHAARLHPRSGVLPHGQPDRGARGARLVADQLLPTRERDAAVPGARWVRRPLACVAARAVAAGGTHRWHRAAAGDEAPVRGRHGRDDGPDVGLRREYGRGRQLRYMVRGTAVARAPLRRIGRARHGQRVRDRRLRRVRRADDHGVRADPERPDRRARGVAARPRSPHAYGGRRRSGGDGRAGRDPARRWDGPGRPRRLDVEEQVRRAAGT